MNKQERDARIEDYGRGYDQLMTALASVPRQAWEYKLSPTDWSVKEIIVHLGDSESMAALRVRKLIVEPGSTLMAYNESGWADALNYQKQDADDSLQIIKFARQSTYRLLKTLPEDVFRHAVVHPEYDEPYTFDQWLAIYSGHIPNHVEQLRKSYEAWKKR